MLSLALGAQVTERQGEACLGQAENSTTENIEGDPVITLEQYFNVVGENTGRQRRRDRRSIEKQVASGINAGRTGESPRVFGASISSFSPSSSFPSPASIVKRSL